MRMNLNERRNPGMVITEGAIAGGYTEGEMRKMFEPQTHLAASARPETSRRLRSFSRQTIRNGLAEKSFS
jgi:hypothetical protein